MIRFEQKVTLLDRKNDREHTGCTCERANPQGENRYGLVCDALHVIEEVGGVGSRIGTRNRTRIVDDLVRYVCMCMCMYIYKLV